MQRRDDAADGARTYTPLRLTTDQRSDYNPVWSPDGRWIAFLRGNPAQPLARSDRDVRRVPRADARSL